MFRDNGVGSMNYLRKVNASLYATISLQLILYAVLETY